VATELGEQLTGPVGSWRSCVVSRGLASGNWIRCGSVYVRRASVYSKALCITTISWPEVTMLLAIIDYAPNIGRSILPMFCRQTLAEICLTKFHLLSSKSILGSFIFNCNIIFAGSSRKQKTYRIAEIWEVCTITVFQAYFNLCRCIFIKESVNRLLHMITKKTIWLGCGYQPFDLRPSW
jgi:hypothetical protein